MYQHVWHPALFGMLHQYTWITRFNLLVWLNMVFQPPKQDTQLMCSKKSALLHRYTARLWSEWAEVSGSLEAPQRKFAGNTTRRYAQLHIYTLYLYIYT
jgi:hypothetical protein